MFYTLVSTFAIISPKKKVVKKKKDWGLLTVMEVKTSLAQYCKKALVRFSSTVAQTKHM